MFYLSNIMVVDCYADADFAGLCRHENTQDHNCDSNRNMFVVNFSYFTLLWVSKLKTYIDLSKLTYEYVAFSHSVRAILPLKILIKEVIDNLVIDS